MKTGSMIRSGKRTTVIMTAVLGAVITLFASGYLAMRAFAATDTYIIHYELNGGNAFSGTDVLIDGNGKYYSSKTTRNCVSAKPTTAERRAFYRWRATASDGTTKDFSSGAQIDAEFFSQKSTSEDGSVYEATLKAVWYKPYRLTSHYINKNGEQKIWYDDDKLYDPDDTESVVKVRSNLDNSKYDKEAYSFVGWTKDSADNGGKHISYAEYIAYNGLVENGEVPVTDFADSTWDETSRTFKIDLYAVFVENITVTYKDPINGKTASLQENPIKFTLLSKDNYIKNVGEESAARKGQMLYYFAGYNTSGGFSGDRINVSTSVTDVHENTTYYARWYYDAVPKFYLNRTPTDTTPFSFGRIRDIPVDDPTSYDMTGLVPDTTNPGYFFKGWSKTRNGAILTHMPADYLHPSSDGSSYTADFYAIWETRSFLMEFDLNPLDKFGNAVPFEDISWNGPATADFSAPANYSETKTYAEIEADGGYTLPDPKALGYTFTGWKQMTYKQDGTSTAPINRDGGQKLPTSTFNASSNPPVRFTFTADYWTKKMEMLVVPNADDGSETIKQPSGWLSQTSADQEFVTFYLGTRPTREGYTFYGWSTSRSVNDMFCGNTADVKVPIELFTEKLEGRFRVTVYPLWKTNITITYDANGGEVGDDPSVTTAQQTANNVDPITLRNYYTAPRFTYGENKFVEWNTKADGSGESYESAQQNVYFTENVTLYAVWNRKYELSYKQNTEDATGSSTFKYSDTVWNRLLRHDVDSFTMQTWEPKRVGYTLKGWSLSDDNDVSKVFADNKIPFNQFSCRAEDEGRDDEKIYYATVYAVWEPNQYELTVDKNLPDAEQLAVANIPEGGRYNHDEVRDGLTFYAPTARAHRLTAVKLSDSETGEEVANSLSVSGTPGKYTITSNYFVHHPKLKLKFEWEKLYRIIYIGNLPSDVTSIANGKIPDDTVFKEKSDGTANGNISSIGNPNYTDDDASGRAYYFKGWSDTSDNNFTSGVRTGTVTHEDFLTDEGEPDYDMIQLGSLGSSKDEYRFTKRLYAVWKKQARLIFDFNGGYYNNVEATDPKVFKGTPDLNQNTLDLGVKRNHYFLDGWNTQADGQGTHYDKGYSFKLQNQEDIRLYAEWRHQNSYRVEFDSNSPSPGAVVSERGEVKISVYENGSNDPFDNDDRLWAIYYSKLTCKEAVYGQRANYYSYLQKGWTYEPHDPDSLTEEQLETLLVKEDTHHNVLVPQGKFDHAEIVTIDGTDYANVKLYAYWQKRGTLYIDANEGRLSGSSEGRYVVIGNIYDLDLTAFPGDTPRREGFFWLGWNTRKDGSGKWYLSNKKADDEANMSRIRAAFGENPDVCRYQDEGVRFRGVNNYEGTDDGTKNILYAQWSPVQNFRIIFDLNTDEMPTPSKLLPKNGIADRLANEENSYPFKTQSGDSSGEKYWKFSTLTPYFYENNIPGYSDVMTYQFKGWSVEKYTPAQADEAVMSRFTVNDGQENATENDPNIENIEITNLIPESFFFGDQATITTVNGKEYLTVTLHAVWKTRAVVRFDANGGYRGRNDAPITEDYRLPGTIFVEDFTKFPGSPGYRRPYHKFIGYCTRTDGSGTWYLTRDQSTESSLAKLRATYGDDLNIIRYMDGDGVLFMGRDNGKEPNTLYAMWRKINNYRITFDINLPAVEEGEPEVTSSYHPQPQLQSGRDDSDTPFIHEDENGGKYWSFSTSTPYARQNKYGKTNLQTYQFKGWSLYKHTADEALTAEIGYDVPDTSQDVDENEAGETVPENNSIQITNKVYKTLFNGDDEDVPVEVWEDENGKEYLSVEVHAVWKERAVLQLIANKNQKGQSGNDGESQYIFTGSIYKENITRMLGHSFTWRGHTFIGYNTKRDGSGTYYMTEYWKNKANENHYLPDGWEDNAVIGTAAEFEGKDNGKTPNVLYGQWVRNYALKYHINYIDRPNDAWFSETGNDYRCSVNYEMMEWTEDGTSSSVYPYHNLRDMLPSVKRQEANNKNYYFLGWSWEKIEGPVDSYDTSKIVDRAEFNDLYEEDEAKWHFKAPEGGDNKYRGDIYAVWSAEPYRVIFDRNTRQSDSDISKPKESHILTFPTDRELSYHDIVGGYTFNEDIPTAKGYTFASDGRWNTSYIRRGDSGESTGKVQNGGKFSLSTFRNAKDSTIRAIANWVPNERKVHYGWEKYATSNVPTGIEKDKVVETYHYESPVGIADGVTPPEYSQAHVSFACWKLVSSDWTELPDGDAVYAADGTTDIRQLSAGESFTMPDEDLYFLAVYQTDTVTVTYDPGEGTGNVFTESPVYNSAHTVRSFEDEALQFSAPEDKTFSGWKLTVGGSESTKYTTTPGETIQQLTESIVYTAQYTDNLYTLRYELASGSADPNADLASLLGEGNKAYILPPDSERAAVDTAVTVAAPLEVEGYQFTGWTLNGTTYAAGETVRMPSGGATLTGVFEPVTYTLHYLTNRKAADSDEVDDTEVVPAVTFQRRDLKKDGNGEYFEFCTDDHTPEVPSGYTFTGWSTTRGGEDNTAPKLYVVCTANPSSVSPYHVYGQWRNWNYLVNYETAHGTAPDPQTFTLEEVMTGEVRIRPAVPTESGYDFLSWVITNSISKTFDKNDLSDNEKNVIPRALFVENASGESGVATAIANWNKLYRLEFDLDGGNYDGGAKNSIEAKEFALADGIDTARMNEIGVALPADLAKDDGSTFNKWQLEIRDGSGSVTKTLTFDANALPLNEFVLLSERFTATLRALWNAPDAHEVTYRLTSDSALKDAPISMPSEEPHAKNQTFNVAAPLKETGYTFSGWYQVEDESEITESTEQINDKREFTMPDSDVTFWGRFTVNSYDVEYYDSDAATRLTSFRKPYGTEITVGQDEVGAEITPAKDGYRFIRWERMSGSKTIGSDGGEIPSSVEDGAAETFRMPAGTVKYRAVYEKLFTLVYDANGGSEPLPASVDYAVEESASSTQPLDYTEATKPTRENYRFLGWNAAPDGTSRQESVTVDYDDEYALDNVTNRFTVPVYAVWEESYTVTYSVENAPGDYDVPDSFRMFAGDEFHVESVPEMTGYDFDGWHYDDNGTERTYAHGESFTMPGKNVTFTGSFTPWTYTLYFKDSLSNADYGSQTVTYDVFSANGSGIIIERNDPEKENYSFIGWAKSKTAEDAEYRMGDTVTGFDENRTATVYALWKQNLHVTYELRLLGGNNDPDPSAYEIPTDGMTYHPGENVTVKDKLSVEGYVFHGWQKDGEDVTEFEMPSSNVVLVGWFTKESGGDEIVHITYRSGIPKDATDYNPDMNDPYDVSVTKGQPHKVIAHDSDLLKYTRDSEKYEFIGWKLVNAPSGGSSTHAAPRSGGTADGLLADGETIASVDASVTLTAQWKEISGVPEPKTYKLKYDGNGATSGKVPTNNTAYKGGETILVAAPGNLVRTGCTFKEWNTKKDGSGRGYRGGKDSLTMPKKDVTLYAIWVNEEGKIVPSPRTGESSAPIAMAFSALILSALAIASLMRRRRRDAAAR